MLHFRSALLLSLLSAATSLVHNAAHTVVSDGKFKHRLRICNAYPYAGALDVFNGKSKLTQMPMEYKFCGDFATPLTVGDKLKFKVGDASAGTFTISDLPNNDAVLLVVIQRHDTLSNAVSFQSHVFANLLNAQIAVIDTYKHDGKSNGHAEISDGKHRQEKLKYNSVVAVNPGEYKVSLMDGKKNEGDNMLVALNRESYVVIRTGVAARQGPSYPQELIVYPSSDPALLHSSALAGCSPMGIVAVLAFLFQFYN